MNYEKLSRLTAAEIIEQLEKQYKGNEEAIEAIEQAKTNIAYIESQKNYKGQTPKQYALELAGNLAYWN